MSTTEHPLSPSEWTDLGSTPCFLQNVGNSLITFVVDAVRPANVGTRGHTLMPGPGSESSANVALSGQRVFARAYQAPSALAVVSR